MMAKCYLINSLLPNLFNVMTNSHIHIKNRAHCFRCHEASLDVTEWVHQLQNEVEISYVTICAWSNADKSHCLPPTSVPNCPHFWWSTVPLRLEDNFLQQSPDCLVEWKMSHLLQWATEARLPCVHPWGRAKPEHCLLFLCLWGFQGATSLHSPRTPWWGFCNRS